MFYITTNNSGLNGNTLKLFNSTQNNIIELLCGFYECLLPYSQFKDDNIDFEHLNNQTTSQICKEFSFLINELITNIKGIMGGYVYVKSEVRPEAYIEYFIRANNYGENQRKIFQLIALNFFKIYAKSSKGTKEEKALIEKMYHIAHEYKPKF